MSSRILIVEESRIEGEIFEFGLAWIVRRGPGEFDWQEAQPNSMVLLPKHGRDVELLRNELDAIGLSPEIVAGGVTLEEARRDLAHLESDLVASWSNRYNLSVEALFMAKTGYLGYGIKDALNALGAQPVGKLFKAPDRALNVAHVLAELLNKEKRSE